MLIVISILGILGAIVTMSMIGLTAQAQQRANAEELMTVQSAMNFMMMEQQIQPEQACTGPPGAGTTDMAQFPPNTSVKLYPRYLRKQVMNRSYLCVSGGTVQPVGG